MPLLYERILAFIDDPVAGCFEDLALAVFAHQFAHCEPYRRFCQARGHTPASIGDWRDIPAVPIVAFKRAALCCGEPVRTFQSSGTTEGAAARSQHQIPDLRLYERSALSGMRRYLFPDVERMRLVSLIAPAVQQPESSLAQMVDWAMASLAAPGSRYAADAAGLEIEVLIELLRGAERDGHPLALLTTTAALMHALDALQQRGLAFRLPHGSRVMDTGGDKGAPRRLSRNGLLHAVWGAFAVPGYFCVNEYGMAELSSQSYDSVIADRLAGRHRPRRLLAPHWLRTRVLDVETLAPCPPGTRGLLCHVDLANAGSAMAVLSEDLGAALDEGFHLLGRAPGAEVRGCSLSAAQWDAA